VFDVDWMGLLTREVLRERASALIAETCAWSVGLSDQPHHVRRRGRLVSTGATIGVRAGSGQLLGDDEDGRLDLVDARPGSFADALNALGAEGDLYADRFDAEVLDPFVLDTCVLAAVRARDTRRAAWEELLDEVGEDGSDLVAVVRAGEWEAPLRTEAEHLVLAALGDVPLIEVEAEGLPLSAVRAAEAAVREAAGNGPAGEPAPDDALTSALFLATAAPRGADLPVPVPPADAGRLLDVLLAGGLEVEELPRVLPHLPVQAATVDAVVALAGSGDLGG
jgi:hypothetical protein